MQDLRSKLVEALEATNSVSREVWKSFWSAQQRFFKLLCISMKVRLHTPCQAVQAHPACMCISLVHFLQLLLVGSACHQRTRTHVTTFCECRSTQAQISAYCQAACEASLSSSEKISRLTISRHQLMWQLPQTDTVWRYELACRCQRSSRSPAGLSQKDAQL